MRKNYIDNLRWLFILLLIPYHAAMAWNTWKEPNYIYFESSRIISSIVVFLSPYFMPLLFLIAGISTAFSLKKRTIIQYISERAKKLLIPFLIAVLLLMPPITYLADKFNYGYSGGFFQHYRIFFTRFTDLTGADGGFSAGHLWFLLYLFMISIAGSGMIVLQKRIKTQYSKEIPLWFICILGIPLPVLSNLLSVGGKSLLEYLYLFLLGYYLFSEEKTAEKAEKHKWLFLIIGLSASVLNVYLFLWCNTRYSIINTTAKFTAEWFMLLALLGIGKSFFNFRTKVTAYISEISFAFYIFHYIWLILFQYLMSDWFKDNTDLLYLLPVILSYPTAFLCCEICKRIPFLSFLTGIKYNKNKKSRSAN